MNSDYRSRALKRSDFIDVAPLRQHFLDKSRLRGAGYESRICEALGWDRREVFRLRKRLGLAYYTSHGRRLISVMITSDLARQIGDAMDLDPVDYGL